MNNKRFSAEKTVLGIELGSTRIKAVLLDEYCRILAEGSFVWENHFENDIWTYGIDEVWTGVCTCYAQLKREVKEKFGIILSNVGAIGISAMMHGYMVFDKAGTLLTPFRTWRNNNAESAAQALTELFDYQIPARWSIAHLYQAIRGKEKHVPSIDFITTLSGYVHKMLTGERCVGVGEASGMFPIDTKTLDYNARMVEAFEGLDGVKSMPWKLRQIMPRVLVAGKCAGTLTAEGAALLDPDGDLHSGIPFCPPEGDAGTGMVATDSVKKGTGNISAGTSIFGMIVLQNELSRVRPEIDLVTTPAGDLVAMVHCNNCTSEINVWMRFFEQYNALFGFEVSREEMFGKLFADSLKGEPDCGGLTVYNYISGENITDVTEGRPMLVRTTESNFNLSNFMRAQIYAAFATLKIGLDILTGEEGVKVDSLYGHGGIFKTEGIFQRYLAAAIGAPVIVMESANRGGPWGMAVLAAFMLHGNNRSLSEFLDVEVFAGVKGKTIAPDPTDAEGIRRFIETFAKGLPVVRAAVEAFKR